MENKILNLVINDVENCNIYESNDFSLDKFGTEFVNLYCYKNKLHDEYLIDKVNYDATTSYYKKYARGQYINFNSFRDRLGYSFNNKNKLCLSKLEKIGIDRFKLYVKIKSINLDRIPNKSSLGRVENGNGLKIPTEFKGEYLCINKYSYTSLTSNEDFVTDNVRYKIEIKEVQNARENTSEYKAILDVTSPRVFYGTHNIYNLNTKRQIKLVLDTIELELREQGIEIIVKDSHIVNLEINMTFIADCSLVNIEKYIDYLFEVLYSNIKNRNRPLLKKYKSRNKSEGITYTIRTKRQEFKFYDKRAHVLNTMNYDAGVDLYRGELKINNSGIQNFFGTDKVDVLFRIGDIKEKYLSYINREVIDVLDKHFEREVIRIEKLIQKCNYKSLDNLYKHICADMLDIIVLGVAAHNVYKINNNSNFSRDFNRLLNGISKDHIGGYSKITSILSKLSGEDIELLIVPKSVLKCIEVA